ncbi:hypothetical protein VAR608DRAFT_3619 [Variovorax sp. HW608]|uniref:hypothetical protein n=1 Tax=Variovorax sp. HW608 TaxID=1034889 RepID=UPI00081FAF12|nr:hypothetical protein [Variovorax sp. HW608]SCK38854.1 hypothetical protein VAR608DRAFT_3619 [Variovorax sp. HW608]
MPRWLIASFIAFVLCCFGFAAAAQARTGEVHPADDCKATVASIQQDKAPADDASSADTSDEVADLDEPGDFNEFLTGIRPLLVPAVAAVWPPRLTPLGAPLPPLERPKRPPRGSVFLV